MNGSSVTAGRGVLLGFISFYAALFAAFGFSSPLLPAFLAERGLKPEQLGLVLGAATLVRLVCGPLAGRLADRFHFLRAQLAVCAMLGAGAALLYLAAQGFWTIMAVSLLQAAVLAPLVPLADALSLAHARPRPNKPCLHPTDRRKGIVHRTAAENEGGDDDDAYESALAERRQPGPRRNLSKLARRIGGKCRH